MRCQNSAWRRRGGLPDSSRVLPDILFQRWRPDLRPDRKRASRLRPRDWLRRKADSALGQRAVICLIGVAPGWQQALLPSVAARFREAPRRPASAPYGTRSWPLPAQPAWRSALGVLQLAYFSRRYGLLRDIKAR